MKTTKTLGLFAAAATFGLLSTMCGDDSPGPSATGGAAPTTGGTAPTTGGTATGGTAPTTGGTATGGTATGGTATGGTATGGSSTGGTATGGTATGGTATGGSSTGGTSTGGASSGGAGGSSGGGGASGAAGSAGKGGGGAGGASGGGGGMNGGGGAAGGGGKGGGGGAGGSGGLTGTFKQVADLLGSKCTGCHKAGQTNIINLTNGDNMLYARLTTATSGLMDCNGVMLVDKTNPSMSILPQAVQMAINQSGCMINRMPNNCATNGGCLSAANIQIITSWVNAGAPEN